MRDKRFLKTVKDGTEMASVDKLFHGRGTATPKARPPAVESHFTLLLLLLLLLSSSSSSSSLKL